MSTTSIEFLFCVKHRKRKRKGSSIQSLNEHMTSDFRIQFPGPPGESFNSLFSLYYIILEERRNDYPAK